MKTTVAAMDFGTSKLVALIAETSGQKSCDIVGAGTALYDGFMDRQWNAPTKLNNAIAEAIHEAEVQARTRIKEINIGVPGDFCTVRAVEAKVDLQGADPHVTIKDIDELFNRATEALGEVNGQIIHRSPAWFMVDDGSKTLEPMNARGYVLRAMVSFVIADQFFIDDVRARFKKLDINVTGCFSTPTGQAMLFIPDTERDRTAVLIDIGYLTTEVMTVEGDAITYLKNIPMGGGNMTADLAYGLDVSLDAAEKIKRAYVFGLSAGQTSFDAPDQTGVTKTFEREEVENILEARSEEICEAIGDAIKESGVKLGNWSSIYLTGGGLAINRGGRDYLSAKLGKSVRELPRKAVKLSSPAYSSALGLLDLVVNTLAGSRSATGGISGFFRNLFGG
ncbi:MAG: hypothetical protein IJ240_01235 [Clostridia bacterium]|nr:hypothetical protein [Clostridia bacterium]